MKINKKIILIVSVILFAAGLVLFTVGLSLEGFDITRISTEGETVTGTYTSAGDIRSIIIDDYDNGIVVTRSNCDDVKVTYSENKNNKYQIDESQDGNLVIKNENKRNIRWFSINFSVHRLHIEIPEDYTGNLDIQTDDGSINISDIMASEIKLVTSDGKITMSDVESGNNIYATTSDGGIYLDKVKAQNDISLETSCGRISMASVACSNITGKTSDGGIVLDSLDSWDIRLSTNNGSIKGLLSGSQNDYRITSKTSDGSNNLPDSTNGERLLDVNTNDGSIKISFKNG